jgi:hypothetical protein
MLKISCGQQIIGLCDVLSIYNTSAETDFIKFHPDPNLNTRMPIWIGLNCPSDEIGRTCHSYDIFKLARKCKEVFLKNIFVIRSSRIGCDGFYQNSERLNGSQFYSRYISVGRVYINLI